MLLIILPIIKFRAISFVVIIAPWKIFLLSVTPKDNRHKSVGNFTI